MIELYVWGEGEKGSVSRRQFQFLCPVFGINRKVAVGSKRGKQDTARNTLMHKRVEHTGELKFLISGSLGGSKSFANLEYQ